MSNAGVFPDAIPLQEGVVTELRGHVDSCNVGLADSLWLLGRSYRVAGHLKEAEVLQVEVLNLRKKILGERHPATITASNDVAEHILRIGQTK
jgi:hypothetical protein